MTTGLVSTYSTPMWLHTVIGEKVKPEQLVSHRFSLHDMLKAYDVFSNASEEEAMKMTNQSL